MEKQVEEQLIQNLHMSQKDQVEDHQIFNQLIKDHILKQMQRLSQQQKQQQKQKQKEDQKQTQTTTLKELTIPTQSFGEV